MSEVVGFVLDAAGEETVAFEIVFDAVQVAIGNPYAIGANNLTSYLGKRETAFVVRHVVAG